MTPLQIRQLRNLAPVIMQVRAKEELDLLAEKLASLVWRATHYGEYEECLNVFNDLQERVNSAISALRD